MNVRLKSLFPRSQVAALFVAASLAWMGAPNARAQLFNWDSALPAEQIERMIQASGYRLTGPVIRRGPVYLADVLGRDDDLERLVVDAREGRLLQRYPGRPSAPRQAAFPGDEGSAPPQPAVIQGWFDREEDSAPPRPPARIYSDAEGKPLVAPNAAPIPPVRAPWVQHVARADEGTSPHVLVAPTQAPTREPSLEKPRPKPLVKRKKLEPASVAQPAIKPGLATPARSEAAGEPALAAPVAADAKAVSDSPPQAAAAATGAPAPKAAAPKPAVNDVPVAPLE